MQASSGLLMTTLPRQICQWSDSRPPAVNTLSTCKPLVGHRWQHQQSPVTCQPVTDWCPYMQATSGPHSTSIYHWWVPCQTAGVFVLALLQLVDHQRTTGGYHQRTVGVNISGPLAACMQSSVYRWCPADVFVSTISGVDFTADRELMLPYTQDTSNTSSPLQVVTLLS